MQYRNKEVQKEILDDFGKIIKQMLKYEPQNAKLDFLFLSKDYESENSSYQLCGKAVNGDNKRFWCQNPHIFTVSERFEILNSMCTFFNSFNARRFISAKDNWGMKFMAVNETYPIISPRFPLMFKLGKIKSLADFMNLQRELVDRVKEMTEDPSNFKKLAKNGYLEVAKLKGMDEFNEEILENMIDLKYKRSVKSIMQFLKGKSLSDYYINYVEENFSESEVNRGYRFA